LPGLAQDGWLDSVFASQNEGLRKTLDTHQEGFQRPSAVLSMYEKRTEDQEELYEKWQDKSLRYQEELRRYKLQNRGKEQRGTVATATPRGQKLKLLQEMMDECGALKVDLVADAAKSPRYVDSLRIHPEEMQRKQKALFKEEITKEATRQRLQAAEMRMRGVQKMQQEQRALRNHMRLEKEHEPLRLVTVSARSQEQKRALSLGAPPWLMSITPRPWSS